MEVGEEKIITRNADNLHPIKCCVHYFAKLLEFNIEVLLIGLNLNEHTFKKCSYTIVGRFLFLFFFYALPPPKLSIL